MKWTPGPWEAVQHGDFLDVIQAGKDGYGCVCRIENADIDPPSLKQQAEVDAKLIAKAPDLYRILARIIEDLPTKRDWLDPELEREAKEVLAGAL